MRFTQFSAKETSLSKKSAEMTDVPREANGISSVWFTEIKTKPNIIVDSINFLNISQN
jgi:hypothetical protein